MKCWDVNNTSSPLCWSLEAHSSSVRSIIRLSDGRLATGSDDMSVKIWSQ